MEQINAYHVPKTAPLAVDQQPIALIALQPIHLTTLLLALVLVELVFI